MSTKLQAVQKYCNLPIASQINNPKSQNTLQIFQFHFRTSNFNGSNNPILSSQQIRYVSQWNLVRSALLCAQLSVLVKSLHIKIQKAVQVTLNVV